MDRMGQKTRARAEMIFRNKQEQLKDAPVAAADYKAAQEKTLQNMLRLRKLRLMQQAGA
jgi:hypothetical protein